jgi:Second Messenger Oligonucleotide or Dinucleotide Synthetase domain
MSDQSATSSFTPSRIKRRSMLFLAGLGGAAFRYSDWSWPAWSDEREASRAPHHAPSHGHLTRFVRAIRTPKDEEKRITEQRDLIRHAIKGHLKKASLGLARSPNSGSYAKRTGTIRYVRGKSRVGGQDVDLPFVLTHRSGQDLDLHALLELFHGFVSRSYPRSSVSRTKSSIKLELKSFPYGFDIVPMVAHPEAKELEYLYRADGTKILTSISRHVKFVRARTQASKRVKGTVVFNDMVRLFKWWREIRVVGDDVLTEVPTFLLELLCASVFDECSVASTYTETLDTWFRAMADIVASRREVRFAAEEAVKSVGPCSGPWIVRDPVNPDNVVVPARWSDVHIDRLAAWLRAGVEIMAKIREHDQRDNGKGALEELERLFGPGIRNLTA